MIEILSAIDVRLLGALAEKELTTPDYYPLTINSLMNACNQKTSRYPVVAYSEDEIAETIQALMGRELIRRVWKSESRVPKYTHALREVLHLNDAQLALLTVLLLRGPQTLGELRQRTVRMYEFDSLGEVEDYLAQLGSRRTVPLVVLLPKSPGQKEARYSHLLSGEPILAGPVETEHSLGPSAPNGEELTELRETLQQLVQELADLRREFSLFKAQFE